MSFFSFFPPAASENVVKSDILFGFSRTSGAVDCHLAVTETRKTWENLGENLETSLEGFCFLFGTHSFLSK